MKNADIIKWAHDVRNGSGIDTADFVKRVRLAEIPRDNLHNGIFTLGIEYGILYAISKILEFDNKA